MIAVVSISHLLCRDMIVTVDAYALVFHRDMIVIVDAYGLCLARMASSGVAALLFVSLFSVFVGSSLAVVG